MEGVNVVVTMAVRRVQEDPLGFVLPMVEDQDALGPAAKKALELSEGFAKR